MAKIYKIVFCLLFLVCFPFSANAANLYFSQLSSSYAVGSTFSVAVYAGSTDQAMNAVSGVVSFPLDKLQVVSLSKTGSVLSLWAEEPSFSNSTGTANFEGIILNPGYTGAAGKVLTINFKAKASGTANLVFSSGSILANDGTGANILNNLGTAVVNISNTPTPIPKAPAPIPTSPPDLPEPVAEESTPVDINPPVIISYPEEIQLGDVIKILGRTYPNSDIVVTIYKGKEVLYEEPGQSDANGDWISVITTRLEPGTYSFTARVTDRQGERSEETAPLTVLVKSKIFSDAFSFILNYLSLAVLILLLVAGALGAGIFMWYKFSRLVRNYRRKNDETEKILEKSFTLLRGDIDTHIGRLKRAKDTRKLTEEEILFLEDFEKDLSEAGDILSEKMKDISRNL